VQEQSRPDREWEHWPGRRVPDDGIRHRLKALFSATDDEQAVEALIGERGREIEEQTARLQSTIEGLERREEQAARLRAAVEEMLRHGSAELDERHAQLTALAADLRTREERVRELEHDLAARRQELGAVELRRAAVERREQAASELEAALAEAAAALRERQRESADSDSGIGQEPHEPGPKAHRLFLGIAPYRFLDRDGPAPAAGDTLEVEGAAFVVTRVGRSPVPGDERPCAYLEPARAPAPAGSGL
jgi:hypothetical protein